MKSATTMFQKKFDNERDAKAYYNQCEKERPTLVIIFSNRDNMYYLEDDDTPLIRNGETIISQRIDGEVIIKEI